MFKRPPARASALCDSTLTGRFAVDFTDSIVWKKSALDFYLLRYRFVCKTMFNSLIAFHLPANRLNSRRLVKNLKKKKKKKQVSVCISFGQDESDWVKSKNIVRLVLELNNFFWFFVSRIVLLSFFFWSEFFFFFFKRKKLTSRCTIISLLDDEIFPA